MSEWKTLYAEVLDREPPASLSQRIAILAAPAPAAEDTKTGWMRRIVIGVVAAAAVAAVLFVLALAAHSRLSAPAPAKPIPTVHPAANGWLAFDGSDQHGSGIFLTRTGEKTRRLDVAGKGSSVECPAFSPDGTRLLFGRLTRSGDAQLMIAPVGSNGAIGTATVIPLGGFHVLHGFDRHPCGTWSPDGRWIALAGTGAVWLVDTRTKRIRRLPNLRPSDLEWRPGTDDLAIAGDMGADRGAPTRSTPVTLYSTATGKLGRFGDVKAAHITWSPDGKTLAYTGGENDAEPLSLRLVDADGSHNRLLVRDPGGVNHGIGPVWSPRGDRIAYQRLDGHSGEGHEVVLVNVADGTTNVIAPPITDPSTRFRWLPYAVWWAPDGRTLLYSAWSSDGMRIGGPEGLVAVPADHPDKAKVLISGFSPTPDLYSHQWALTQMWSRLPASASATASAAIHTDGGWQVIDQGRCINGTQLSFGAHSTGGEAPLSLTLDIPPAGLANGGNVRVTDGQLALASGAAQRLVGQAVVAPGGNSGAFTVYDQGAEGKANGDTYAGAWTCRAGHTSQQVRQQMRQVRLLPHCSQRETERSSVGGAVHDGYRLECGRASAIVWVGGRWQVVSPGPCTNHFGVLTYPDGADPHWTLEFHLEGENDAVFEAQRPPPDGRRVGVVDGEIDLPGAHTTPIGSVLLQRGGGGAFDLSNHDKPLSPDRADYVGAWTCVRPPT